MMVVVSRNTSTIIRWEGDQDKRLFFRTCSKARSICVVAVKATGAYLEQRYNRIGPELIATCGFATTGTVTWSNAQQTRVGTPTIAPHRCLYYTPLPFIEPYL